MLKDLDSSYYVSDDQYHLLSHEQRKKEMREGEIYEMWSNAPQYAVYIQTETHHRITVINESSKRV